MVGSLGLSQVFDLNLNMRKSVCALVIYRLGSQKVNIFGEFDGGVAAMLVFLEVAYPKVHLR